MKTKKTSKSLLVDPIGWDGGTDKTDKRLARPLIEGFSWFFWFCRRVCLVGRSPSPGTQRSNHLEPWPPVCDNQKWAFPPTHRRDPLIRSVPVTVFFVFLGAVAVFAVQNTQQVSVAFLRWSVSAPLALLIVVVYVLGMLSGANVVAFLRMTIRRVRVESRGSRPVWRGRAAEPVAETLGAVCSVAG